MKQLVSILLVLLSLKATLHSQIPVNASTDVFFNASDSQKLSFRLQNKSFFKNNEYFNPLHEGYTLPGIRLKPTIAYLASPSVRIEIGADLLRYHGRDGIFRTEPIFRFQYQPINWFQMNIGTLYGGAYHALVEPLYQWESDFTASSENGLQFLFNTPHIKADVWLNWQQFIQPGDAFQEKLMYGNNILWKVLPENSAFNVYVPFQAMVSHCGGQIISIDAPLQTIANIATGLRAEYLPGSIFGPLSAEFWYLGYNDLSPQKLQRYKSGFAFYPLLKGSIDGFHLECGYFFGQRFQTIAGESLFSSANIPYAGVAHTHQELVTAKLYYQKMIGRGLLLAAYYESYANLRNSQPDYTYRVHLVFDRDFFIAKIPAL
jgi:hypothetical protein